MPSLPFVRPCDSCGGRRYRSVAPRRTFSTWDNVGGLTVYRDDAIEPTTLLLAICSTAASSPKDATKPTWPKFRVAGTTTADNDLGSTTGERQGGGSSSSSSAAAGGGSSGSSSADEEMSAAAASAAASAIALKNARKTEKKAARAAAAAAAAVAATGTGLSAVEPTTTGRRPQHHQHHQPEEEDRSLSGTAGSGGGGGGGSDGTSKKKKQRANAKPCVFFPRGRCRYGDGCRFSHDIVEKGGRADDAEEEEEDDEVVVLDKDEALAAREAALDRAEKLQVGRFRGSARGELWLL